MTVDWDHRPQPRERAARLATTKVGILISGETGSGKEYFARAFHDASPRRALEPHDGCTPIEGGQDDDLSANEALGKTAAGIGPSDRPTSQGFLWLKRKDCGWSAYRTTAPPACDETPVRRQLQGVQRFLRIHPQLARERGERPLKYPGADHGGIRQLRRLGKKSGGSTPLGRVLLSAPGLQSPDLHYITFLACTISPLRSPR